MVWLKENELLGTFFLGGYQVFKQKNWVVFICLMEPQKMGEWFWLRILLGTTKCLG